MARPSGLLLALLACLLTPLPGLAETDTGRRDLRSQEFEPTSPKDEVDEAVITPGSAERVQSLFLPHKLGDTLDGGWKWDGLSLQPRTIELILVGPDDLTTRMHLDRRDARDEVAGSENTASFAVQLSVPKGASDAPVRTLLGALRANDDGSFWGGQPSAIGLPSQTMRTLRRCSWLLLAFALMTTLFDRRRRDPKVLDTSERAPEVGWPQGSAWLIGLLFAALLHWTAPLPPLHNDTLRDAFLAIDCSVGRACFGASSSFAHLQQGAGWVRLLGWLSSWDRSVPGPFAAIKLGHYFAIVVHALVLVLLHNEARRWLPARAVLPVTIIAAGMLVRIVEYPVLHNPTLASLPVALFFVSSALLVAEGRLRWVVLAAVSVAAGMETHPMAAVLFPALLLITAAFARRLPGSVAFAMGILPGWWLFVSPSASEANLHALVSRNLHVPLLAGLAAIVAAGLVLRPKLATWSQRKRVNVTMFAMSAALLVAPAVLSFLSGKELVARYVPAALVAVPILLAPLWMLVRAPWLTWASFALISLSVGTFFVDVRSQQTFSFVELQRLAAGLKESGETWASVTNRFVSPENSLIQSALAAAMDLNSPDTDDPSTLRIALTTEAEWSGHAPDPGWNTVFPGSEYVSLHARLNAWVDTSEFTICISPDHFEQQGAGPSERELCGPTGLRRLNPAARPNARLSAQVFPELVNVDRLVGAAKLPMDATVFVKQKLRVRPRLPEESPVRHLQVMSGNGDWVFVSVDRLDYRGALPAREIELLQHEPSDGEITIAPSRPLPIRHVSVPVLFETTPEEPNIRAFLRERRVEQFVLMR